MIQGVLFDIHNLPKVDKKNETKKENELGNSPI